MRKSEDEKSPKEYLAALGTPGDIKLLKELRSKITSELFKQALSVSHAQINNRKICPIYFSPVNIVGEPNYNDAKKEQNIQIAILDSLKEDGIIRKYKLKRINDDTVPPFFSEGLVFVDITYIPKNVIDYYERMQNLKRSQSHPENFQGYITRKGSDFFYRGEKLGFTSKKSFHYLLFATLYSENGESKLLTYKEIEEGFIASGRKKLGDLAAITKRIQNAINVGLFKKVKNFPKEDGLVEIVRGEGVRFFNPPRN